MATTAERLLTAEEQPRSMAEIVALPDDAALTVEEVALWLRTKKSWVYEHSNGKRGKRDSSLLKRIKVGGFTRFRVGDVRKLMQGQAA